eukprot:12564.XXX_298655_298756_1 [CDS] Oithona nana genome sequencing.
MDFRKLYSASNSNQRGLRPYGLWILIVIKLHSH